MNTQPFLVMYDLNQIRGGSEAATVSNENNVDTRFLRIELRDSGRNPVSQDCTATAAIVYTPDGDSASYLHNDAVPCEIIDGAVIVPIDDLGRIGNADLRIELTVSDASGEKLLVTPYPIRVRVTASMLDDAQVTPETEGSVPELIRETREQLDRVSDFDDGKSAYEVAVDNGFVGTEQQWLASLRGATGAKGDKGDKGDRGDSYDLTAADKAEIASLIESEALEAAGRDVAVIQNDMGVLVSDEQEPNKTAGKYLKSDGTIGDVANNAFKVTEYIDVEGYTQAVVTGSASTSNLLCAFYDVSYQFISGVLGEDAENVDKPVGIPLDAKYIVVANDARSVSACSLTKWRYTQIAELRTGYREFTTVWEQGEITGSGTILYNQYPARTGWLSTETFDYLCRTDAITEGMIYYYDYDETQESYTFKGWYKLTPGVNHVIDKSFTHFRLKLFIDWSTVVDLTTAKSSLKLYQYQTAASAPVWFGKKWAAIGDSLTEINSTATAKYHDLISERTGITVVNLGVGGTGYKATNGGRADSFMERVASVPLDADVVTIFGSGNDLGSENEIGTPTDTGTTTLCGCINTAIDSLLTRMPLVNLGIITPTPWQQYNPATSGNRMLTYSTAIIEICRMRGIPCLDLYHCSGLRPWDNTFKGLAYANADGVHPNNKGHALIAPRIEAFLDSLLPGTDAESEVY